MTSSFAFWMKITRNCLGVLVGVLLLSSASYADPDYSGFNTNDGGVDPLMAPLSVSGCTETRAYIQYTCHAFDGGARPYSSIDDDKGSAQSGAMARCEDLSQHPEKCTLSSRCVQTHLVLSKRSGWQPCEMPNHPPEDPLQD